jgi:hypothetical protein
MHGGCDNPWQAEQGCDNDENTDNAEVHVITAALNRCPITVTAILNTILGLAFAT